MIKVSDNYYVSPQISEEDLDYIKNEGFSLVELVVVIAVLAILSAVAIPAFKSVRNNAKV